MIVNVIKVSMKLVPNVKFVPILVLNVTPPPNVLFVILMKTELHRLLNVFVLMDSSIMTLAVPSAKITVKLV